MGAARIAKILVPTDFSDTAKQAMAWAADLAVRFDAQLTVLHVYQIPGYVFPEGFMVAGPETLADLMNKVELALVESKRSFERLGAPRVGTLVMQGAPHLEIVRAAREGNYDLVVMGTHGRTGLRHALLGSVAERVVRKASCPVLTVRPQPEPSAG